MRWRDFDELPLLPDDFFSAPRRVHFIGVGGIGMSALAFLLAARGHQISGSDAHDSPLLQQLREANVKIYLGHQEENVLFDSQPADAIVFGSAITASNPERIGAEKNRIPQFHRAQILANFVNRAAFSIAVSGTHGKSTTSAMIAHALERCGKNPTALLGAQYPPFGSNVRLGDENLVVVEADESDGSFTLCRPTVAVVTNVEAEHLENYDDSESELWRAFEQFVNSTQIAVLNADDETMCRRLTPHAKTVQTYSAAHDSENTWKVGAPGKHNLSNARGAVLACEIAGVPRQDAAGILSGFHGVARRFQFTGEADGVRVYDDYAHHPTEVQSTLEAARDFLNCPIIAIFQPHRFSRTAQMGRDFGPSFAAADTVIITQLYSAFEEPIEGVSGKIVFDAARESSPEKPIHYVETLDEARQMAIQIARPGSAIITMGAGDIGKQPDQILADLQQRELQQRENTDQSTCSVEFETLTKRDEPLGKHTTMKVGGPARWWAEPQSEEELSHLLREVARRGLPLRVLGAGSNLIASDDGFDGVILNLGEGFATRRVQDNLLVAGGAALLPALTHFALKNQLGNFEWACGIPGTVGGSVWGNAGARGFNGSEWESRDAAADLHSLVAYERNGTRRELKKSDITFEYRRSSLNDLIVTEATFALKLLNEEQSKLHRDAVKDLLQKRRETQPVSAASAGCIWKNPKTPDCHGAGELIERLGLKNSKVGAARISEIHGNFIVNDGDASSGDVMKLMEDTEATVREKTGIQLEREVRFLGD